MPMLFLKYHRVTCGKGLLSGGGGWGWGQRRGMGDVGISQETLGLYTQLQGPAYTLPFNRTSTG